jgi:hypothetical protein
MPDTVPPARPKPTAVRAVAWQGWQLELPRRWDPVQLAGDAAAGHALFADAARPRLGLRWATPRRGRRFDAADAVRQAMVAEVGALAAAEATPVGDWESPLLYVEPDPPGRDVWVAFSPSSGRLLTVACPVRRRDHVLAGLILPGLDEWSLDRAAPWAVFDLSVVVPGGMALTGRHLNAGDLSLSFADRRGVTLTVRQVALAEMALRHRTLDGWLADQQRPHARHYRVAGTPIDVTVAAAGRSLDGRQSQLARRRRFALATWRPRSWATVALHDPARDRLVILHGTDGDLLRTVAETVGVADDRVCMVDAR